MLAYFARPVATLVKVTVFGSPGKDASIENVRVTETVTLVVLCPPVHVAVQLFTGLVGLNTPASVAH